MPAGICPVCGSPAPPSSNGLCNFCHQKNGYLLGELGKSGNYTFHDCTPQSHADMYRLESELEAVHARGLRRLLGDDDDDGKWWK